MWIVWWVGLAYVQAFAGDLWSLINPWRTAYDAADRVCRRLGRGGELTLGLTYPSWLGAWPACLLLLGFSWIELIYPNAADPWHIAWLAIAYSVLTWAGMAAFGRDLWLRSGEVFSLVFGTLAHFAPTEAKGDRLLLRPFGAGLLEAPPLSTSMVALVLLLLATVLYDGLIGTGEWAMLEEALRPLLPAGGEAASMAIRTAGLIAMWLIFLAAYLGISALMSRLGGGHPGTIEVAQRFALTLVPIAIGYHVAHYLVFLLVQGQYIIPLLSDPLGLGWNLLGTSGYRVDIGLVGARFAWYAAVAAIVVGHVTAVYLAHLKAVGSYAAPGAALKSQVPLTALMVAYTVLGLSITAQPIVESRAVATPTAVATETAETVSIPPGAVLPRAPDGDLATPDKSAARVKLTYSVLGSAFHDGTRTGMADLLYAYVFAYRWGVRDSAQDGHYDPVVDAATATLRRHLVAVRPVSVDAGAKSFLVGDVKFVREILAFEVYLDIAPGDPDAAAMVAPPWSTLPWHVLVLMEEAVSRGWAAFSEAEASRRGVPWLDLVRSGELNGKLAELVSDLDARSVPPQGPARARHRGGGAPALAGARSVLQGQRPFPGDQRTLQAQELDAGERHAGGVSRPYLPVGCGILRCLRYSPARVRHQGGVEGRASEGLRGHRGRREVPAQLPLGAHAAEGRSEAGLATRSAGISLRRDRQRRARSAHRNCNARRRCNVPGRLERSPGGRSLHPVRRYRRQRQRRERGNTPHCDRCTSESLNGGARGSLAVRYNARKPFRLSAFPRLVTASGSIVGKHPAKAGEVGRLIDRGDQASPAALRHRHLPRWAPPPYGLARLPPYRPEPALPRAPD